VFHGEPGIKTPSVNWTLNADLEIKRAITHVEYISAMIYAGLNVNAME
jgi:hypothetical protein